MMQINIKSFIPHIIAAAVFLMLSLFYFSPQFSGKSIAQTDIMAYRGMSQEVRDFKEKTGETSLWTNAMFGGMPTYQINNISSGNFLYDLIKPSQFFVKAPAGQFIAAMLCFYIFMVLVGVNPWLSIIGAIGFGFATNNLILYEAGHVTKLRAITYLPIIATGMLLAFRKRYILGALIFGIGAGLDISANHVQMTYYFFLTMIIWGAVELFKNIKDGTLPHYAKAIGFLFVGGILGVGAVSSNLLVTYEYAEDTMRGKPILENPNTEAQSSSQVDGLEWTYAMNWSNNTLDLFSSFIPGVAGGGSGESISQDSPFARQIKTLGSRVDQAPLYWGGLPFTSGPIYFGAIMVLFFLIGLVLVKGPVKWWLGLGTLLTLMLSMGSNLEGFNRFFFDYMPLFNKFRTPNSVLSVTSFLVPALAILTLDHIVKGKSSKEEMIKALGIGGGIAIAIALFFSLAGGAFFDFSNAGDASRLSRMFGGQVPQDILDSLVNSLEFSRAELMQADSLRTLLLVLIATGATYFFINQKINTNILVVILGILIAYDAFDVGMRYLNKDDFQRIAKVDKQFTPRDVDTQILEDTDPNYRVYDATRPTFESAQSSYLHKTVGGYHAAKLQRYQDIIERHLTQGNQKVLDMLNTKYFILPDGAGGARVQANPNAMGNAWFVSSIKNVDSNNAEIDALNTDDPKQVAIVHQEFNAYTNGLNPTGEGNIKLTSYKPNEIKYTSQSNAEQLAVFSEIWYGPNKGWQAYIDGKAVDHIRADYVLRALKVPSGNHEIVFKFDPQTYKTATLISSITSLLLLLGLVAFVVMNYRKENKQKLPS